MIIVKTEKYLINLQVVFKPKVRRKGRLRRKRKKKRGCRTEFDNNGNKMLERMIERRYNWMKIVDEVQSS